MTDVGISDIKNNDKNEKKDVEKHIKETIKKDNANLLPEIIIEEVQDNREIAIPSSSSLSNKLPERRVRRSVRLAKKKPYDK